MSAATAALQGLSTVLLLVLMFMAVRYVVRGWSGAPGVLPDDRLKWGGVTRVWLVVFAMLIVANMF